MLIAKAISCSHCQTAFTLREYSPGHVGIAVYHCDTCPRSVVQHKSKIPPDFINGTKVEQYISPCECGGRFGRDHAARCPSCLRELNIKSLLGLSDDDITKRDSGRYYVVGYDCALQWNEAKQ